MSAYLDVVEADAMEEGWRLQTVVRLKLRNQLCSSMDVDRSTYWLFMLIFFSNVTPQFALWKSK